ncbi:MAG TPA: hypothetical protein VHL10_07155, partial [Nitrososphaera sp.]|nr:hypothetical protein [Nitrososphaera sp.]
MPIKHIVDQIRYPDWAGPRFRKLDVLERFLDGTIYDHLPNPFHRERDGQDQYIPLRDRRPSVIYGIPKIVVDRSISKLFGDKHWPRFHTTEAKVTEFLQELSLKSGLQGVMSEAAYWGSLGSVFIYFAIVKGKLLYEVWNSKYCTPKYDAQRELDEVLILVPFAGYDVRAMGYAVKDEDMEAMFFVGKRITTTEEIGYNPVKCDEYVDERNLTPNKERSVRHDLKFVPGVWIKNFIRTAGLDAPSTFGHPSVLTSCIEIDYQLSQCGRGLKYNSDPQLLIKEPPADPMAGDGGSLGLFPVQSTMVRSTSNTLFVGPEGDASLLEISGDGQKAVLEYVKQVRQYAYEAARASRKDQEHTYGNMSGRAMEILEEDLISLASDLRLSYGESALKELLVKILRAHKQLKLFDFDVEKDKEFSIDLMWGNWFDPTPADLVQIEQALTNAIQDRRIYMSEGRMVSSAVWGLGHG